MLDKLHVNNASVTTARLYEAVNSGMFNLMDPCFRWVSMVSLSALVLTGCTTTDQVSDPTHRGTARGCESRGVMSGSFTVGEVRPVPPTTEVPATPIDPVRPSLLDVDIERPDQSAQVSYQLAGDGNLGWTVRFVEEAVEYGSSNSLTVAGSCILQVDLAGVAGGASDTGTQRLADPSINEIAEVLLIPLRDNISQSFIGIDAVGYAIDVTVVDQPTRLVVSMARPES